MTGRLALVLSGGGAQAAYFGAGVALGLAEAGMRPEVLSGTSAGALNAGLLSCGVAPSALVDMWSGVNSDDVYRMRHDVWRLPRWTALASPNTDLVSYALAAIGWTWLLDTAPARRTLAARVGGERLPISPGQTLVVSAVNQATGAVARFTNSLPCRETSGFRQVEMRIGHLLASTAVPMLFPPVDIDGGHYVDAGLVANTPLAPALAYEPDVVVVVASSNTTPTAADSLDDALGALFTNVARFSLLQDFRHARTVNKLVANAPGATAKRQVELILVEPAEEFAVSGFLRFDPGVARTLAEHGRDQAKLAIRRAKVSESPVC